MPFPFSGLRRWLHKKSSQPECKSQVQSRSHIEPPSPSSAATHSLRSIEEEFRTINLSQPIHFKPRSYGTAATVGYLRGRPDAVSDLKAAQNAAARMARIGPKTQGHDATRSWLQEPTTEAMGAILAARDAAEARAGARIIRPGVEGVKNFSLKHPNRSLHFSSLKLHNGSTPVIPDPTEGFRSFKEMVREEVDLASSSPGVSPFRDERLPSPELDDIAEEDWRAAVADRCLGHPFERKVIELHFCEPGMGCNDRVDPADYARERALDPVKKGAALNRLSDDGDSDTIRERIPNYMKAAAVLNNSSDDEGSGDDDEEFGHRLTRTSQWVRESTGFTGLKHRLGMSPIKEPPSQWSEETFNDKYPAAMRAALCRLSSPSLEGWESETPGPSSPLSDGDWDDYYLAHFQSLDNAMDPYSEPQFGFTHQVEIVRPDNRRRSLYYHDGVIVNPPRCRRAITLSPPISPSESRIYQRRRIHYTSHWGTATVSMVKETLSLPTDWSSAQVLLHLLQHPRIRHINSGLSPYTRSVTNALIWDGIEREYHDNFDRQYVLAFIQSGQQLFAYRPNVRPPAQHLRRRLKGGKKVLLSAENPFAVERRQWVRPGPSKLSTVVEASLEVSDSQ